MAELALALTHLHARNILYRDVKMDNVLIGADGHVRLVDFGLVHAVDPAVGFPWKKHPELSPALPPRPMFRRTDDDSSEGAKPVSVRSMAEEELKDALSARYNMAAEYRSRVG